MKLKSLKINEIEFLRKIEFNPFTKKYKKGMKKVALVYPNRYVGGISNIGLQIIYSKVFEHNAYCERFYYDVFDGIRSFENATPLQKFDIALFSLQYELDYFRAIEILKKGDFKGLKIAGGPAVMINPKPLTGYFDAFFIGEVEEKVEEIIEAKSKEELSGIEGVYTGKEDKVKRVKAKIGAHLPTEIVGNGVYGRCFILEIGRGCIRKCRFCVVRTLYSPPRWRKIDDMPEVKGVEKVVLVAPSPTDNPNFLEMLEYYVEKGFKVSPSSIRADTVDEKLVNLLHEGGLKTLTLAPETASEHLQELICKNITSTDILNAAKLSSKKFNKIKLYFMIGLPYETMDDVKGIVDLANKVKEIVGVVKISVNPLVPKPHTPFQWLPFGGLQNIKKGLDQLKRKIEYLKLETNKLRIDARIPNITEYIIQTILSRGDESVSKVLEKKDFRRLSKFLGEQKIDETFPWDFIDHGYNKNMLLEEYEKIMS
ncbi:MAG: radical SAM protein [Nitrososphaeria archaeon]|nr:radical SAM protein [Nitrososphaeria archaeon]